MNFEEGTTDLGNWSVKLTESGNICLIALRGLETLILHDIRRISKNSSVYAVTPKRDVDRNKSLKGNWKYC